MDDEDEILGEEVEFEAADFDPEELAQIELEQDALEAEETLLAEEDSDSEWGVYSEPLAEIEQGLEGVEQFGGYDESADEFGDIEVEEVTLSSDDEFVADKYDNEYDLEEDYYR